MENSSQVVIPFFTFKGIAKEAMEYYVEKLPQGKINSVTYYEDNDRGLQGKVMNGSFEIMGLKMMVMDMEDEYCPDFSWATTMLLQCASEAEFDQIFDAFANKGKVMMGPEEILGLRKVAWVTDRFNVTWQLVWQ